jgi:hypothetical protein
MSTANMERSERRWLSDATAVVIYSVLVIFFMLSWAYIPAWSSALLRCSCARRLCSICEGLISPPLHRREQDPRDHEPDRLRRVGVAWALALEDPPGRHREVCGSRTPSRSVAMAPETAPLFALPPAIVFGWAGAQVHPSLRATVSCNAWYFRAWHICPWPYS